jgi:hypothetical protein
MATIVSYQSPLSKILQPKDDLENRLLHVISDIDRRLQNLENRIGKIPDPFVLYYRAPGGDYKKINEILDDVHGRINMLELLAGT